MEDLKHCIPKVLGGGDNLANLVPACRSCNASKNAAHPRNWDPSKPLWKTFSDCGKIPGSLDCGTTRGKQAKAVQPQRLSEEAPVIG